MPQAQPRKNRAAPAGPLQVLSKIKATTGQSTVPQIFVGGKLLGGASDVVPLAQSGGLQQLLASTQGPPLPAELQAVVEQAVADGAEVGSRLASRAQPCMPS